MYPSLLAGDYIVVDTRQRTLDSLHRGRIVIYRMARDGTTLVPADRASPELRLEKFVKRVVGLAGDAIDVTRDELRINGALVARRALGADVEPTSGRELALYEETLDGAHYSVAEMPGQEFRLFPGTTVEKNRFFVLGDNRDNANDSRYSGTIHRSDLVGVVSHIYFSRDPSTKEIRWERIGRVVR